MPELKITFFKPLLINRVSLDEIVLEPFCRPLAKQGPALGFNPIPYGYDDIEVVILDLLCFSVGGSCRKICDN